jgi:hypothetical protein
MIAYGQNDELKIRSLFVEAISRFITWPDGSKGDSGRDDFVVGIIGEDDLTPYLKNAFLGKKLTNKIIHVKIIKKLTEIEDCKMIYISSESKFDIDEILKVISNKSILTICDNVDDVKKGFMVGVYIENKKIQCSINESEVKKSNISISYHLLQKAKIINPVHGRQ